MLYTDTVERSTELLRQALPLMSRQAAALHPTSYALWYAYAAQRPVALRAEVDHHLARHGALDEAATEALFRRHLAQAADSAALASTQRLTDGMSQLLVGMSDSAAQASDQTHHFGQTLQRMAAELGVDSGRATEPATLDTLRHHTEQMRQAMAALQQRLADSQREIDTLRAEVQRARHESLQDALTGLANRRAFDQQAAAALAAALSAPVDAQPALLMIDIDHFKRINDRYGHPFGDQVLKGLAQVLRTLVPAGALAARVGGEEFAVLLPGATAATATALAERLRQAIAHSRIRRKGPDGAATPGEHITVSVGVAPGAPGDNVDQLVDRADRALYASKAGGRDRVTVG